MDVKKKYKIEELNGPFGYRREGGGIVIYLFIKDLNFDACSRIYI